MSWIVEPLAGFESLDRLVMDTCDDGGTLHSCSSRGGLIMCTCSGGLVLQPDT